MFFYLCKSAWFVKSSHWFCYINLGSVCCFFLLVIIDFYWKTQDSVSLIGFTYSFVYIPRELSTKYKDFFALNSQLTIQKSCDLHVSLSWVWDLQCRGIIRHFWVFLNLFVCQSIKIHEFILKNLAKARIYSALIVLNYIMLTVYWGLNINTLKQ